MLILQRIVQIICSTRIKGPLVRSLGPLAGTQSPIPDLHWHSAAKTGGGFDQINLRSSAGGSHLPRRVLATKGDMAAVHRKSKSKVRHEAHHNAQVKYYVHSTFGWTRQKF